MVEGELAAARETSPSYTDLLARLRRRSDSIKRKEDYKHAHLPEQWSPSPSSCNPGFRAAKSVNSPNRSSFPRHGVALFGHTSYNSPDHRLGPFFRCRELWRGILLLARWRLQVKQEASQRNNKFRVTDSAPLFVTRKRSRGLPLMHSRYRRSERTADASRLARRLGADQVVSWRNFPQCSFFSESRLNGGKGCHRRYG